jgi:hypothetical protein
MLALMRPTAAIPVLVVSAALLAGCGGGGRPAAKTTGSTGSTATNTTRGGGTQTAPGGAGGAGGAPGSAGESATATAQGRAFASAVNLKAADVLGFHVSTEQKHQGAAEKRLEPELLRCVGATGANRPPVEASSQDFEQGASILTESVSSQVTVARTPALAAKELASIRGGHLQACLSRYFNQLLKSQNLHGASVGPVSTKHGSPPAPGADGSFGLRFTETLTLRGLRIPFYVDILGFVKGPAEVSLFTFGVPRPFPAALEERLFLLLLARAKAHKA